MSSAHLMLLMFSPFILMPSSIFSRALLKIRFEYKLNNRIDNTQLVELFFESAPTESSIMYKLSWKPNKFRVWINSIDFYPSLRVIHTRARRSIEGISSLVWHGGSGPDFRNKKQFFQKNNHLISQYRVLWVPYNSSKVSSNFRDFLILRFS